MPRAYKRRRSNSTSYIGYTEGTDNNDQTIGSNPVVASTFKVPYVIRQIKHKTHDAVQAYNYATLTTNMNNAGQGAYGIIRTIGTGTGISERIGNTIFVRGVNLRYQITGKIGVATSGNSQDVVRVICFVSDSPVSVTSKSPADFMVGHSANQASTPIIDPDYASTFKVKYDKTHSITHDITNVMHSSNHQVFGQCYIPINKAVTFADAQPDLEVQFFSLSTDSMTAAPADPSTIAFSMTVTYTDA